MDPYVYPGTTVLKNLRQIQDAEELLRFEAVMTARRLVELEHRSSLGAFNTQHLQAIHRHIFQDVYPWAGEFRTVNISRSGQYPFAFSEQIVNCLTKLSSDLQKENWLNGLAVDAFCRRAAFYLGELNAIHPFRDGNGRSQREFLRQLARQNGFKIQWSRISRPQMISASQLSFQRADNSGFEEILRSCCV